MGGMLNDTLNELSLKCIQRVGEEDLKIATASESKLNGA